MCRQSLRTSALILLLASSIHADTRSIGPAGINSAGLGLTGAGVRIGQVEPGRPGDADVGDNLAHRNTTTNPAGVFIQNIPGNAPPNTDDVHGHAQEVAGVMISTSVVDSSINDAPFDPEHPELFTINGIFPTGVATGASLYASAYVTEGTDPGYDDAILTFQRIATIPNMRAINHSWGKEEVDYHTNPNNGESKLTMALDWSANRHNVLHLVAGNQGMTADLPAPKDNYNGMTIGRSAKAADGVYRRVSPNNNYSQDAFGDRTSIALIAPGDDLELATLNDANRITNGGTSYATPHVTGTVALLQQNASTAHQRRHEVMKAVLMNSTDKIKGIMGMERTVLKRDGSTWFGSEADTDPTISLDMEMGTGHLNASRALQQFQADEFDPGSVPPIGWDYNIQDDPFILNNYSFTLGAGDFVSATLVWDRIVFLDSPFPDYAPGNEFIDFGFANLDLYLKSSGGAVIKASTSTASNVEHIFAQVTSAGTYTLEVFNSEMNLVPYAVAWWAGPDERPATTPGDFNSDGRVDGLDLLVWQRNPSVGSLSDWQNNYGTGALGAVSVPEPGRLVLLLIAAGFLASRCPRNNLHQAFSFGSLS
jgi:hypothetical protein